MALLGRFKAIHVQEESGVAEVARYLHLNPVRIGGLGLSKADPRRAKSEGVAGSDSGAHGGADPSGST